MAQVRLSVEEYLELLERAAGGAKRAVRGVKEAGKAVRKARKGKKDPKMARALKKANSMGRKKSGGFKKGWSQGKIMKKAHQLRRRM